MHLKVQTAIRNTAGLQKRTKFSAAMACIKRDYQLYLILIPFLIYMAVFVYKPMYGLQIAFKDYSIFKGIEASPWNGLKNFEAFFSGPYFWPTLKNTLLISCYALAFGFPFPILLAILFNEIPFKRFKSITQTMSYLPHFISAVVIAGIVTNFLSPSYGLLNLIIEKFGGEKQYFLTKPEYFRPIYTAMNVWKEAGFGSVIYLAALSAIDTQLYEAAVIDGAGKWQQIRHVTLPGIRPTVVIMLLMNLGNVLNVGYETIILLYQPVTYETADVISTYVYRLGLINGDYATATAAGFFNSVAALALTVVANQISRKVSEISLW